MNVECKNGHKHSSHHNSTCYCSNQESTDLERPKTGLTDYSPKDRPWNKHRADVDDIAAIYGDTGEFEGYAKRMAECSVWLGFKWEDDQETGESTIRLRKANFCRCRYCPVCQWRRSLMWQARFLTALPRIVEEYPKSRWIFVTLTVRNCEITELSDTLVQMNKAWNKFIKRKDFRPVQGWIRTTEVTRGDDRSAHPHFHVLMMVPPSWFGKNYVKQSRFIEIWKSCLKVNYEPNVDVRVVKPKKGTKETMGRMTTVDLLKGAVSETLKYSTKADTLKTDKAWFLELTRQTFKKQFMATGGALKEVMKDDEPVSDDDLIHVEGEEGKTPEEEQEEEKPLVRFKWRKPIKEYHRTGKR